MPSNNEKPGGVKLPGVKLGKVAGGAVQRTDTAAKANPETVFEVLIKHTIQNRAFITSVNGTIMFVVIGDNPGVWTLDLRRGAVPDVYRGRIDDPSVLVAIDQPLLLDFIEGTLDVPHAFENNQLGVSGDMNVLAAFATALGAGSALDLRALVARSAKR